MNSIEPYTTETTSRGPRRTGAGVKVALALLAVAAVACNIYLLSRLNQVEDEAKVQRADLETELDSLHERLATQRLQQEKSLSQLRESLDRAERSSYSQARNEAQKRAANVAKDVEAKQRQQQDMFLNEIGGVRDATSVNAKQLGVVKGQMEGVAGRVDETRRDLAETEDVLLSTQDQLAGVNSRVESHSSEIETLRSRTERMLTKFTLDQSKERTKVDNVQIRLKDADVRKNRYTVEILADDQVIVQKDRNLNEPVEFYVTGADRPYEIVVTDIQKGKVSGYLSKPKFAALTARR